MNEDQKIVILLDCFAKTEAEAALALYAESGGDASKVIVAPITEIMSNQNTAKMIEEIASGNWPGGTPRSDGRRSGLIARAGKREAVMLMRCFKKVIPSDADPAFAMVTTTGATWTVDEYLKHIRKEHTFMKTASPEDDPDMKEVD